jgi:hypothetical protein
MDKEMREEIRGMIFQAVAELGREFRTSTSSVEISRTSSGKPGITVKVYHDDPIMAANKARDIEAQLALEYMNIPRSGSPALKDDTGGPTAVQKSPDDDDPFKETL